MKIADKLYQLRKEKGCSQEELAYQVGVSRQAVSKWESGQAMPDADKLILLSDYFMVSLDELLKEQVNIIQRRAKKAYKWEIVCCSIGFVGALVWTIYNLLNPGNYSYAGEAVTINLGTYTLVSLTLLASFMLGIIIFIFLRYSR